MLSVFGKNAIFTACYSLNDSIFKFYERIKNPSNCSFSQSWLNILNKGHTFSFITPLNNEIVEEFAGDINFLVESSFLNPTV